ncbi:EamA family transporter [Nocardioides zeae]
MSLGQFGLLYAAIAAGMPPGIAALVLQAQVLLTIVIAAGVLGERPSARQGVGVLVGTLGLAVVAVGRDMTTPLLGLLLCLGAALSWAAGNVAARAAGAVGGLSLTVWSALAVPVPALALSLLLDGPAAVAAGVAAIGVPALLSTLYTAVLASLVGYGIFTSLLGRYPAGKVVPWILLVPPVAMAAAWLVRGTGPRRSRSPAGSCCWLALRWRCSPDVAASRAGRSGRAGLRCWSPRISARARPRAPTPCRPERHRRGSPAPPRPAGR